MVKAKEATDELNSLTGVAKKIIHKASPQADKPMNTADSLSSEEEVLVTVPNNPKRKKVKKVADVPNSAKRPNASWTDEAVIALIELRKKFNNLLKDKERSVISNAWKRIVLENSSTGNSSELPII